MFDLFANILAFFYAITHNYALAIALLTLCVMIVLTPLTLKGTKNMLQLQKLQPEIKRLQAEHKGDRQKLNEEMMALYKENKINPLSGCLPLLLQAPVFIILYRVLHGLTRTCPSDGTIGSSTCTPGTFYPDYVKKSSELFQSLVGKTEMVSFGLDLSKPATKQLSEGFLNGLPYLLLVLVVAGLSFYQQRQVTSRMKDNVNPQQQLIMKIIPVFFAFIALTLPAGLIVYFITSSLYRIAQQAYITRKFYRDQASKGGDDSGNGAKKSKPTPPPTPTATAKPKPSTRPTPKRPAASGKRSPAPATPPKSTSPGQRPTPNRPTPRPRPSPSRPAPKKK